MKKISVLLLLLLSVVLGVVKAQSVGLRLVVAADGSGQYRSVQAALDALPRRNEQPVTIFIKKGLYKENLHLDAGRGQVRLLGESAPETILTGADTDGLLAAGSTASLSLPADATLRVAADDFMAENLTFHNPAGKSGPAPALLVLGDRVQLLNCRFLSLHSALLVAEPSSRVYAQGCYFEGSTDLVAGAGTLWLQRCTLHGKAAGNALTAPATPAKAAFGMVLQHCIITGDAPASSYVLARPQEATAKAVFLHCEMHHLIKPEGWGCWGEIGSEQSAFFAEYKSHGHGGAHHQRHIWSHWMSDDQAALYTLGNVLRGWSPAIAQAK